MAELYPRNQVPEDRRVVRLVFEDGTQRLGYYAPDAHGYRLVWDEVPASTAGMIGWLELGGGPRWTLDWPQAPGVYWFYGYLFDSKRAYPKQLYTVHVKQGKEDVFHVAMGAFVYEDETWGIWTPALAPTIPTE